MNVHLIRLMWVLVRTLHTKMTPHTFVSLDTFDSYLHRRLVRVSNSIFFHKLTPIHDSCSINWVNLCCIVNIKAKILLIFWMSKTGSTLHRIRLSCQFLSRWKKWKLQCQSMNKLLPLAFTTNQVKWSKKHWRHVKRHTIGTLSINHLI